MSNMNVNGGNAGESNFDWKQYQQKDAIIAAIDNNFKVNHLFLCSYKDTAIAKELTNICDQMAENYDTALADKVEYEIESGTRTIDEIKKELQETKNRVMELSIKQMKGEITEEEKEEELKNLSSKIGDLKSELCDAIADEIFLSRGFQHEVEKQKGVKETALEYSDVTIDVGTDVVSEYTRKGNRFLIRLLGKTFDEQIKIGDTAIKSGVNLESVVKTADIMENLADESVQVAEDAVNEAEVVIAESEVNADESEIVADEEPDKKPEEQE